MTNDSAAPRSLNQQAVDKFRNFWHEFWRIRWMLAIAVGVVVVRAQHLLPETSATLLVLYKPSLAAIGFIVAHVGYQQAFPYLDQRQQVRNALEGQDVEVRQRYTLLFIGTSMLRGLIYAAFILGVTLGL